MSRSPLFARVSRVLRIAQYCEQQSISTQEGLERTAEARHSRRDFIGMAAATVALP